MQGFVDTPHKLYAQLEPKWEKLRILDSGEEEVHAAGTMFLPKLEQHDESDYKEYVERTRFLPAFSRTVQGLKGTITRKDPTMNVEGIEELAEDITLDGSNLIQYSEDVLDELLRPGVAGTLIDYDTTEAGLTVAQVEERNLRPRFAFYKAENILNWKYDRINNKQTLSLVVLKESSDEWVNDFETEEVTRYRVLRLDDEGKYYQELFEKDGDVFRQVVGEETEDGRIYPKKNNEPLKKIPFYFHGEHRVPPLYSLCTTNVKHYQLKADHNHALHYVGLPTPIFPGVDPNDPKRPKTIGPGQVIHISNPQAKPYFMVYGAEGLVSVENELEKIKEEMAFLGAQMLATTDVQQETATKAAFRHASETSALAAISGEVSKTLTEALRFLAEWAGIEDSSDIFIKLNKDFEPEALTPQKLLALVSSWLEGAFSKRTLYANLQKGEIADAEKSFEEEEEEIAAERAQATPEDEDLDLEEEEDEN